MLDECKNAQSPRDLEAIAQKHDIEVNKLESLRGLVSNPVVDQSTVVKTIGEDGEERITMKASVSLKDIMVCMHADIACVGDVGVNSDFIQPE